MQNLKVQLSRDDLKCKAAYQIRSDIRHKLRLEPMGIYELFDLRFEANLSNLSSQSLSKFVKFVKVGLTKLQLYICVHLNVQ